MDKLLTKFFENRWLLSILLLALVVRTININFNSAFMDESIYIIIGKKFLSGRIHETIESISWVGGLPFPQIDCLNFK